MFLGFGQTWTRLRAGSRTGSYSGQSVEDWTNPDRLEIHGCTTSGASSVETARIDLVQLQSSRTWHGPPRADVKAGDRLEDPHGVVWTIEGEPFDFGVNPHPLTGWAPGCTALIRKG